MSLIKNFLLTLLVPLSLSASWSIPNYLGTFNSRDPSIAIDTWGNTFAVWTHSNDDRSSVQFSKYDMKMRSWSKPTTLSSPNAKFANIAIDSQGNAMAIWISSKGFEDTVQAAYLPARGTKWRKTKPVPFDSAHQILSAPQLAFDGKGNILAVWGTMTSTGSYSLQSARLSDRVHLTWTAVTELPKTFCKQFDLAVNKAGNALLIWLGLDGIRTATLAASANYWTVQQPLSTTFVAGSLQAVLDKNNNAVVAWWEENPQSAVRAFRMLANSNQWRETPVPDPTTYNPRLGIDGLGTVHLLCHSNSASDYSLQSSTLSLQNSSWTAPLIVLPALTTSLNDSNNYELAVDKAGNAIAVWSDDINNQVLISKLPASGQNWSEPLPIATSNFMEGLPKIALSSKGLCHVVFVYNRQMPPVYPQECALQTIFGLRLFKTPNEE